MMETSNNAEFSRRSHLFTVRVWGEELARDMSSAAGFAAIEVKQPAPARDPAQKCWVHFTCRLPPFILHGLLKQQHDGLDRSVHL